MLLNEIKKYKEFCKVLNIKCTDAKSLELYINTLRQLNKQENILTKGIN